ncbi:MAG: pimeloyl-CoA dehydrogenase large subunit [Alphaproteobacteria bacterium]|nr:pimeloyl-CoA dehydrogenase large subunit [Alphaproteobacteria bacterium]
MELQYPAHVRAFADEVRAFTRGNLPAETRERVIRNLRVTRDQQIDWQRKLCERGWACPAWPKEYGGPGFTPLQRHVFDNVTQEEGAPAAIPFGESMIAPVIMAAGSAEQKAYYLPKIRTMEYFFCQGFSEPGSGSDLASLRTSAKLEGDEWVINGQKMWTSMAHHANMIFMLVRTDSSGKPQEGITMLVFSLDRPGITIRPIITMDEGHHTNEVFFDNVRVPKSALIGEANKGWNYAKLLLGHERTTIARIGQSRRQLRILKDYAASELEDGAPLIAQQRWRDRIAAVEIELMALEVTALRSIAIQEEKGAPGVEANLLKVKGSEIQQKMTELLMDAAGPYAIPFDEEHGFGQTNQSIGPDLAASLAPNYLSTRVVTIYGGSNEIQRNIVAKTLGL